jgi:hypothetical protein
MGAARSLTRLHFDDDPVAVLHQLSGRKVVILIPPEYSSSLSPAAACTGEHGTVFSELPVAAVAALARGDTAHPSLDGFPLARTVPLATAVLGPGDALYIPSGWWHAVRGLEAGVSVSVRALSACEELSFYPYELVGDLVDAGWLDARWRLFCVRPFDSFWAMSWLPTGKRPQAGISY